MGNISGEKPKILGGDQTRKQSAFVPKEEDQRNQPPPAYSPSFKRSSLLKGLNSVRGIFLEDISPSDMQKKGI